MPRLAKPAACTGCSLEHKGLGYAPADGPSASWLLLVGEALGSVEALTGRPFMGDAGGMLTRLLRLLGWERSAIRIDNTIRCQPPGDWFDERAPWYHRALAFCPYLESSLSAGPQVVVPMGQTALRRIMGYQHHKKVRVQDFHGSILRDPHDRFWVVPTYHPSYLQRGAHNLIGTVLWDLQQAEAARDRGRPPRTGSLVIDPPIDWFRMWVDQVVAARTQDPAAYPLSSDVETPDKAGGKDEGEITAEDRSFQILRQNFACHPDEGITVPHVDPYIEEMRRLYASPGPLWQWNREYDFQRLVAAGLLTEAQSPQVIDLMWLAHYLQSDLPRGLGFWAPFYSDWGPWKHLADSHPAEYGGVDGLQTHRVGTGVYTDLQRLGLFAGALRHTHTYHTAVLRPAQLVGVKVDRARLTVFKADLAEKARVQLQKIQAAVPPELQPLTPKGGLTRKPLADVLHVKASAFTRKGTVRVGKPVPEIKQELYAKATVVERLVLREVLVCRSCGAVDIQRRHRCVAGAVVPQECAAVDQDLPAGADRGDRSTPLIELAVATVTRWFWQEPLNPDSPPQVLAYIRYRKHAPGRAKKTGADSTDRETLKRLTKTGDPFYRAVLDYRAIAKVKGTYVEGTERRLDLADRLHPQPSFKPSTMRLSYVNPNITNVVADKDQAQTLAAGFRRCLVASSGCQLIEVDFSAIEAVETGWCARDPLLIRLASLGIHSYLIAKRLNDAPDLSASDADIRRHLQSVKKAAGPLLYDQVKHTVYGVFYGQTPYGLAATWPDLYPDLKTAEAHVAFMFDTLPSVKIFQQAVLETAATDHVLGGAKPYGFSPGSGPSPRIVGHPFGYRHWFWSVYVYKRLNVAQALRAQKKGSPTIEIGGQHFRVSHGPDANRAIAFYPQSIAAGVLKEALLRLLADPEAPDYIGDLYYGQTPLRAPVHDSGLFEVPTPKVDHALERITRQMTAPILQQAGLTIGVAAKVGFDWASCEERPVGGSPIQQAVEGLIHPMEAEDAEDVEDLGRAV
jgi:uracil-DNA glycosylase family 4